MNFLGIFLEGFLSFVSPCVLPLVPLYMSYLSNGARDYDEEGNIKYKTLKIFVMTLFFVLGISVTFVILALSLKAIRPLISKYSNIISIIGGTVLIFFALHDLGIITISFVNKTKRINLDINASKMSYIKAFLLGFVFSFAWTPCIGPLLSNALMLAATEPQGYLYILFYALGLVVPFIVTGLFTSTILNLINKKKNILKYTTKIAGVIILCFAIYMIYNASKEIVNTNSSASNNSSSADTNYIYVPNTIFKDQDGNDFSFEDYKGKYIFMNFSATWCTYCESEIPYYEEFSKNSDAICIYVMSDEVNEQAGLIKDYYDKHNLTNRIIVDENLELYYLCQINSFPTLFVIGPDGSLVAYAQGAQSDFEGMYNYAKEIFEGR